MMAVWLSQPFGIGKIDFFLSLSIFLGGKMCFFELNIGSWTVNVLPLKYTIQLHANELFDIYIIWILQLGEIPG